MDIKQRRNQTAPDYLGRQKKLLNRLALNPKKVYLDFSGIHNIHEQTMYQKVKKKLINQGTLGNQLREKKIAHKEHTDVNKIKNMRAKSFTGARNNYTSPQENNLSRPFKKSHYRANSLSKVDHFPVKMQLLPPRMLLQSKRMRSMELMRSEERRVGKEC